MSATISHMFSQLDSTIPYSAWAQLGSDIDGEAADDESGYSVSLSTDGRTVAIGSRYNDNTGINHGHVRIFSYNDSTWSQLGSNIHGISNGNGNQFGRTVSLSANGRIVAIGGAGGNSATNSGYVQIYEFSGSTWSKLGSDISGEQGNDNSGYSVSLSADGKTVAIGAPHNDDGNSANDNRGNVRIFSYSSDTWSLLGGKIVGEAAGDNSGKSVSLSADGRTVAIGAHFNNGNGVKSGHVRIYQYDATKTVAETDQGVANFGPVGWNRLGSDIDGEAADDRSGYSLSLSADGQTVAIGAINNDTRGGQSGHVRILSYSGSTWSQLGLDIDGELAGDQSGWSVSLSADGRTVAIGAYLNGGHDDNGHVRIYSYNGTAWVKLGLDIDGEVADDNSGYSVSLSADGRTVAIGAPFNDGNGSASGHVRIYNINSSYNTFDTITVGVVFSEPVNITNTPILNVLTNLDGTAKLFSYASGDGTNVLYFTKTISAGEIVDPLKILNSTQPTLTGTGTIKDSASNDAVLTLSSDITFYSTIIDSTAPTISHLFSQLDSTIPYSAWAQLGSDIDGEAAGDYSGWSVSLSADGQTVAIGAILNDAGNASNDQRGHVRIYSYNGSSWSQLGSDIDGEAAGDRCGYSVSLSADGQTVAIGAIRNDAGNASDDDRGHVRIFSYNGSSWSQLGSDIDGEAASDYSGVSVSLSADGQTVAIGALLNDAGNASADNRSHVRIFSYNGSGWVKLGLDIDGEATGDRSGSSVSLSADGQTVAIGAYANDAGNASDDNRGHVRIYSYNGSAWSQLGSDIDGEAANDQSGISVSLSADGRTVAIGGYKNDAGNASATDNRGHVRIYSYSGSAWSKLGSDIDGEAAGDLSGVSVSLSADGQTVAIGAPDNDGNGNYSGHVRIFSYNGSVWSQLGLDIDGEAAGDYSGYSVSLSADGRTVAIGAYANDAGNASDDNRGHVRIYNIDSSYNTFDTITVGVVFSEPVNITNTPILNVLTNLDGTAKLFSYASGDGTNVLYFTKTISAGEIVDPLKILNSTQPTLTGTGTIKDSASNDAVLTLSSDITFHSVIITDTLLNLSSSLPTSIDNILNPTIQLTFVKNIVEGSGNVTVKRASDDVIIETIAIGSFTISGKIASYTLTSNLNYNSHYYINIAATAIDDTIGNSYEGVSDKTTLTFSTKKLYSSSLYKNGRWENPEYLNPVTGNKRMFGGPAAKYGAPATQGRPSVMFSITSKRSSTKK